MSSRPEQPEPFLRGCVFPAVTDAPYPRADPAGAEYLPADVWDAAQLPVGVRLELAGNARTIRVWYKTTRASLGYRGESAGCSFVAYRAGQKVATVEAVMGEGMAELVISGRTDLPVTVYLPEGMQPLITGVAGVEETMVPAPPQPRWLAYGDAVTQGWLASAPAMAWPAVAGRKLGLDVCNLGYAGTARGESTSAVLLAETPAEVISIAFGLNNWSRVPHTAGLMSEEVRCFLAIVRKGHPDVPIIVVSPTARPDAEDSPNRVGATLAELRLAMEEAVLDWIGEGDKKVYLVEGLSVVGPEDLEDGIYPGDEGHRRLAAAVAKVLVPQLSELQEAARLRRTKERLPGRASAVSPPVEIPTAPTGLVDGGSFDLPLIDAMSVESVPAVVAPVVIPPVASELFTAEPVDEAPLTAGTVAAEPFAAAPVAAESVAAAPVAAAPVAAAPVAAAPVSAAPVSGNWWLDEPDALTGNVFDPTPPAGGPLEVDPQNVATRNLDLPDVGSLGPESLNHALLDALSSNGPITTGSPVDGAPVDDPLAGGSFVPDSPVTETYTDETYSDERFGHQPSTHDSFIYSFVDDSPFGDPPVSDGRSLDVPPDEGSFAEYSYLDDLPIQPVVFPTLEDTLAQAAAAAPVDGYPITDATPVPVPPFPAPELDDSYLDGQRLDPSLEAGQFEAGRFDAGQLYAETVVPSYVDPGAPVEPGLVETAPVETAPIETSPVAVPSPTTALNGEVPVIPSSNGTALASAAPGSAPAPTPAPVPTPPAHAVRREGGPVDIAVADMVVAALTLATNGADDVIYAQETAPADGLQWAEAADPASF